MDGQSTSAASLHEQDTQKMKYEKWTASQAADIDAFWNSLIMKTPQPEAAHKDSLFFPLEEVESCVKDKSSISFLPPAGDEVPEMADIHDEEPGVDEHESNEKDNGQYEQEPEPSTSASAQVREPEPGTSRSLFNINHENEEREREMPTTDDESRDRDAFGEPRPFSCTLCSAKFPRKLLLSAHVEKRHGVKYVFTERGKKVKLVRMPEVVKEGDKLDPFVELLLRKNADVNQKSKDTNALLVQPVDPNSAFTGVAEELDPQDVFKNILGDDANCGILVDNLDTRAYIEACNKGEVPFVAFGSVLTQNHSLLRIIQLNDNKQILVPATPKDIKNPTGMFAVFNRAENSRTSTTSKQQSELNEMEEMETENGQREIANPAATAASDEVPESVQPDGEQEIVSDFSNLCVVAYADVVLNKELKQFQIAINSPVKGDVINSEFIKFDEFKDMVLLCKPKRLRCLSELYPNEGEVNVPETSDNSSNNQRPKRKYTRRNYGKENQAKALAHAIAAGEDEGVHVTVGEGDSKFQVLLQTDGERSSEKKRRSRKTEDDDDDEEKDATYSPSNERKEVRAPKKRRRYVRINNPAKRRLDFDECDEEDENKENEDKDNMDTTGGDSDGADGSKRDSEGVPTPKAKPDASIKKETSSQNSEDSMEKEGRTQNKRGRGRPPKFVAGI